MCGWGERKVMTGTFKRAHRKEVGRNSGFLLHGGPGSQPRERATALPANIQRFQPPTSYTHNLSALVLPPSKSPRWPLPGCSCSLAPNMINYSPKHSCRHLSPPRLRLWNLFSSLRSLWFLKSTKCFLRQKAHCVRLPELPGCSLWPQWLIWQPSTHRPPWTRRPYGHQALHALMPGHLGPGAPRGTMRQAPSPMAYKVSFGSTCYVAGSFTKHFSSSWYILDPMLNE